jgi:putative ABC transport system permease protein
MYIDGPRLPALASALLRRLLPDAERNEVLDDLAAEYGERVRRSGPLVARAWVWRQVLVSTPALVRRGWWTGWSGFEPRANRWRPGGGMFESWGRDVRYALRRLRFRPAYTGLTALTLALGVAGAAAVYGIARPLLLERLPVAAEEEVVVFWNAFDWSDAEFVSVRPDMEGFRSVATFRPLDVALREDGGPARLLPGISASSEFFEVLGVRPMIGTGFQPGDDVPGADPVVVLSHQLWRELGGDPGIVGERIELAGVPRTVAGVMPPDFWFPDPAVRVWLGAILNPENGIGRHALIGRLPPGIGIDGMGGPLEGITTTLGERFQYVEGWDKTTNAELTPVREHVLGTVRPAVLAMLGAMAVLLLVACVNAAALMLGQVDGRGSELAVRSALGAERRQLIRQLVVEALAIGALAGAAGAALAVLGHRFLVETLPLGTLAETAGVDWSLFAAAMGIALVAAAAVALVPAATIVRGDLQARLTSARTAGVAGGGGRLESGLVVAQVALVLLMTSGSALLIRSVANLRAIDPGVEPRGVAVIDVVTPGTVPTAERPRIVRELIESAASVPGVVSAGAAQPLPLRGGGNNWGITIENQPDRAGSTTFFRVVSPEYFATMGIRIRSGRGLLETDRLNPDDPVVVINQALADRYFPGIDPIGQRIGFTSGQWDRIVGVAENVAEGKLTDEPQPTRYMLYEHVPLLRPTDAIVLRVERGRDAAALLDEARRAIQAAHPGIAVQELTTMERVVDAALGPARQVMAILTLLSALALALGVIGVYGVVSHFVGRRRRDWGIRMALGLGPARVVAQIVRHGGMLVGAGIALGLAGFLVLARVLAGFLYGVGTADPVALAGAAALLMAAGLAAAYVPARRASRMGAAVMLREL